jgi:hypothetical protein
VTTDLFTPKSLIGLTRADLRMLIDGLDHARGYTDTLAEGEANDALRARLVRAADSLPPDKDQP